MSSGDRHALKHATRLRPIRDRGVYCLLLPALLGSLVGASSLHAGLAGLERVATGLSAPMFTTFAPGDRTRLFIAERGSPSESSAASAAIRILNLQTGALESTPFLTITGVNNTGEGGLLGLAFHPDYQTNGKFYVNLTANDSVSGTPFSTYIREYTRSASNPNLADTTFTPVLNFTQPQSNHNGGWIGFSPNDGYLYIMTGDGGGGNDTGTGHTSGTGNAQDITDNFLGKVLRVDVDRDDFATDATRNYGIPYDIVENDVVVTPGNPFAPNAPGGMDPTGDNEIWAYGLRNPFRASFDRASGDLWIGDVGQSTREEIDFQGGNSQGGENYGWRLREGSIQNPNSVGGPRPPGNVDPVYDYPRTGAFGGTVVTGGYVYRGPDPTLQGKYFFADSNNSFTASDDKFWMFDPANPYGTVADIKPLLTPNTGAPAFPVAFGEDAVGNLYIVYLNGNVYRIRTNALTPGDFDADADVDGDDVAAWTMGFATTSGALPADGDADSDGDVDGADFLAWQRNVGWSPLDIATEASAAVPEPMGLYMIAIVGVVSWARDGGWRSRREDLEKKIRPCHPSIDA